MFIAGRRIVRFAFQNFRRNFWLSLLTTSILALALLSVNLLLVLNIMARAAITAVEDRIDVSVYFKPTASAEIVGGARSYLLSLPQVRSVEYTSPEVALQKLRERHAADPVIQDSVRELEKNPLGATLAIKARNPADYPAIIASLDNPTFAPFVAEKNYGDHRTIINRIQNIARRIERSALMVSIIFVFIAGLIVFNSIRIALFTRREEIGIMRLVGASNAFIRTPFLIEALMYSLLATIIALAVTFPALGAVGSSLARFFDSTSFNIFGYFVANAAPIFALQFIGASLLSIGTAAFAVGRYLKV